MENDVEKSLYEVWVKYNGEGYSERLIRVYAYTPEQAQELALETYRSCCVVFLPPTLIREGAKRIKN